MLAPLATPPYYAVVFTSTRTGNDPAGYDETAALMESLARQQPGYLGIDSARSGTGITVSYWRDIESIRAWKAQCEHLEAQRQGRAQWYSRYTVRICRVEREYEFGA